jgi:antirestriction protein ArdC
MAYKKKYNVSGFNSQESAKEREDKVFDRFADMLIEKLEKSQKTNWQQPWFAAGGIAWPKALYGKDYHGMNAMMLMLHCEKEGYKIPVFATHEHIYSLNYKKDKDGNRQPAVDKDGEKLPFVHVLKGEKSFPVFLSQVNVVHKDTKERIKWSEYVNLSADEQREYNVYHNRRLYNVFNVDQTNIKDARPELYAKLAKENIPQPLEIDPDLEFKFAPLDTLIDKQLWICPIKVQELKAGESPHFSLAHNEVVLALKSQYVQGGHPESWVNDAFHEMTHSTGVENCLDRFKPNRDKDSYAREELVAEVCAALCCHRYGIPKTIKEDSVPYVQSWLGQLHEKPEFIRTVLKDVKMATSVIDSKFEEIRRLYLGDNEDDKLDLREDVESSIEYDDDGDMHLGRSEVLGADKKQGDSENKGKDSETEDHKRGVLRR